MPKKRYSQFHELQESRRPTIEKLESRSMLTTIGFAQHEIISTDHLGQTTVDAADLDGDGDLDIVAVSSGGQGLIPFSSGIQVVGWYANEGSGNFGEHQLIQNFGGPSDLLEPADLNGDGAIDLVIAEYLDGRTQLSWVENVGGTGDFAPSVAIVTSDENVDSILTADLDNDGDADLIVSGSESTQWHENLDGRANFSPGRMITPGGAPLSIGDLDSDGDLDLLTITHLTLVWYENADGGGTFEPHAIEHDVWSGEVSAGDVDGDGDLDILAPDGWRENLDGRTAFGPVQTSSAHHSVAVDLDGDGDLDALSGDSDSWVTWRENTDGLGTFGEENLVTVESEIEPEGKRVPADLDGDGDMDLLFAVSYSDTIAWVENTDGHGTFSDTIPVVSNASGARSVVSADLDGDGDLDAVSASDEGKIAWYPSKDGEGSFGQQIVIDREFGGTANQVVTLDLDADGDDDIVASIYSRYDNEGRDALKYSLVWYENTNGLGRFSDRKTIASARNGSWSFIQATDVDGDGDFDLMAKLDQGVVWYEHLDVVGQFSEAKSIVDGGTQSRYSSVNAADMDGDGDIDAVVAKYADRPEYLGSVGWYENTDGRGTFASEPREQLDTKGDPSSVFTADLDGDGDVDVLSAERTIRRCFHLSGGCQIVIEGSGIVWYENVDGSGRLGTAQVISDSESTFARAEDFDGDGDMDVIAFVMSSIPYSPLGRIAWYENIDGKGVFGPEQVIASEASNVSSIAVADVDSDGDQDLLSSWSTDGTIAWHENRPLGDSNDDGAFDSSDLVAVFAAGEYEDDISNNSTFDEGDWNGDGDFDTADLVAVFKAGTFSRKARAVELTAAVEAIFEFEGMKDRHSHATVHGERYSAR